MHNFNQNQYLERINFKGKVSVNLESLKAIHHAQHITIPFENFDICFGRGIHLEPEAIFQKLVTNQRGGYCFELNGLLLQALQSFGFEARALLGRVHLTGTPTGRSHQVTLVTLAGKRWLVDLGFGAGSPPIPLPLIYETPVSIGNKCFQFIDDPLFGYMLQRKEEGEWKNAYSFDLNHVCQGDLAHGNHYTSTSKKSFFTTSRVAALPIENGMLSLFNHQLKKVINGQEQITVLKENPSYLTTVEKEFGIVFDANFENLKPLDPH